MLSLTVFWINAWVRSYSLYCILATIFFVPGFIEHYHVFIHIFFKVFKVLYPVLVDRSKSPIKYANLCTEKNSKKETIYSIFIGLCIYLYIYIYIQTSSLFLNHYTLFFFSLVNLQLNVRANEEECLAL